VIFLVLAVLLIVGAIRLVAEVGRRADLETIDNAIDAVALEDNEEIIESVIAGAPDETSG
jgi:HAMP domain-containing protein